MTYQTTVAPNTERRIGQAPGRNVGIQAFKEEFGTRAAK